MTPRPSLCTLVSLLVAVSSFTSLAAQDRATRVRRDLERFLDGDRWIYNDLEQGRREARESGKPLLVVFRCIPCDACRGFDEQVASFDPRIRELLDRFVRVRIPQANGADLSLFQFDFDLSFYAFFLNADGTVYGRFGSPSTQKDKKGEVSVDAFRQALTAVLDLHGSFRQTRDSLRAKTGPAAEYRVPEDYPSLRGRYASKLDYKGDVVKSCIHCHQIRDAERRVFRRASRPIPDRVLFPWPLPEVFGIGLDPRKRATVATVEEGSLAEREGFRPGDEILTLSGQPMVSIADVQWVLHRAPDEGRLKARIRRDGEEIELEIPLAPGWRRASSISWRVSTWDLRRMATGGLLLEEVPAHEREYLKIAADALALRAKHVGQYGEHATAKNAGFRKGDIILAVDGRRDRMTESEFIAYGLQEKRPGDRLELEVRRGQDTLELAFDLR